jgi:hypothetical protein
MLASQFQKATSKSHNNQKGERSTPFSFIEVHTEIGMFLAKDIKTFTFLLFVFLLFCA